MEEKTISPQAERLIKFISRTGMNHTEFGRECGFKSTRTLQSIHTDGKAPSLKVLNKIVQHFPMLNYDWVLMGVGEMINAGFEKNSSSNSTGKSQKASFGVINKKLTIQDLAVNELGLDVTRIIKNTETNMLVYTQTMAYQGNKIDEMVTVLNKLKEQQTEMQKYQLEATEKVFDKYDSDMKEHVLLIRQLDKERKELAIKLQSDLLNDVHEQRKDSAAIFKKQTESMYQKLSKKLDINTKNAIDTITNSGENNTAKALKALGEHTKHKKN